MNWFLYVRDLRLERVNRNNDLTILTLFYWLILLDLLDFSVLQFNAKMKTSSDKASACSTK